MERIANQLVIKWKRIIESIEVDGYSRKVESSDLFRMDKHYTGYPEIEFCYKVNFNFQDGLSSSIYSNEVDLYSDIIKNKWHEELEDRFNRLFYDFPKTQPEFGSEAWWKLTLEKPKRDRSGETKFSNKKADYMTNQGYRFIVQFYPEGFISDLREEKLEKLDL